MSLPRDPEATALGAEFRDWEIWQGPDGAWHARIRGATPPVMVHGRDLTMLREQIIGRIWLDEFERQQQRWSRERPRLRSGDDDDR